MNNYKELLTPWKLYSTSFSGTAMSHRDESHTTTVGRRETLLRKTNLSNQGESIEGTKKDLLLNQGSLTD